MAIQTNRLHYFDMLKGIAIFMVVMGHVITFCVREIDSTPLFKFIGQIHMPLFFFISGWFGYKTLETVNVNKTLISRFKQLIVPMVVVSSIWVIYFGHSGLESPIKSTFADLWQDAWKNGYWFTLVLFEIILVQLVANGLFRRFKTFTKRLIVSIVIWIFLYEITSALEGTVGNLLSLQLVTSFWPAYMSGFLAAGEKEKFNQLLHSNIFMTACFVIAAPLLYILCWYWEFPMIEDNIRNYIVAGLFHIPLAIIAIAVVKPWAEQAYATTATAVTRTIADIWSLLGRKSLAIYLLHYFFLFNMSAMRQPLIDLKLSFVPTFVISAVAAAAIIAIVLMFERIISASPLMGWLLTGSLIKKAKPQLSKQ